MRVHITGAAGSGTTTLGRALATHLGWPHFDSDDYFWLPTQPPYRQRRLAKERLALYLRDLDAVPDAVASGSLLGWGDALEGSFGLVVFLYVPTEIRLERLRRREAARFGVPDPAFLQWAAAYDVGPAEGRSLPRHEAWLAGRTCPVVRIEGEWGVEESVGRVVEALRGIEG